ncbi:hypothetical protein [Trinickia dinghuensis]|uniref:Uncharacterized protein n=1 Tax=Trinickia dinghuensis TaxID=2291023 RepID=A0A3D8K7I0_9BURK|nr:hypothetical protein [Trinickia dinghuensis]RDV00542.1 hypothetical protein DWV00_01830 [Trinickia dinghuensis]
MKIIGYSFLWAIVFALLVSMCAILKEGRIDNGAPSDSDAVAGKIVSRSSAQPPTSKPISHAALGAV